MKCSIAMTTYNGSKYIFEQLESIKKQTRTPDEVIIVDDVSKDDTVDIVKQYIRNNNLENWRIIKNESNVGWKNNFRKAMKICTGDILFFCDQDDIWHTDKIDVMCNIIENNSDVKVLVSNYVLLYQGNLRKKALKGSERDDGLLEKISRDKNIGTIARPGCTFAFTSDIAELMLAFDDYECAHDHVVYNLGLITNSLYIVNRQLIDFRRHTNNASTPSIKFGRERKKLEIKERIRICNILLNYCKCINNSSGEIVIQRRKQYYTDRMDLFLNGNLIKMIGFILSNINQYATFRDIIVDLLAMTR